MAMSTSALLDLAHDRKKIYTRDADVTFVMAVIEYLAAQQSAQRPKPKGPPKKRAPKGTFDRVAYQREYYAKRKGVLTTP